MKAKTFTPEQQAAIDAFDKAVSSSDLTAFGWTRKHAARCHLVNCADKLAELKIDDAMTPSEASEVRAARNFIN